MSDTYPAYVFQADLWCPRCIGDLASNQLGKIGNELTSAEKMLDLLAYINGVSRYPHPDTNAFPSGVLADQINPMDQDNDNQWVIKWDHCGQCGDCLGHDWDDCHPTEEGEDHE